MANSFNHSFNKGRLTVNHSYQKIDRKTGEITNHSEGFSFNLFGLIVVVILACSLAVFLGSSSEPKTFYGFLQMLQEVPSVDISWITHIQNFTLVLPDWLAWLAPVLNVITGFLSLGSFFIAGALQALAFILYFLGWIFS